ncbi:XkdX family protein [Clostridium massiliamazoniense]|uniref:XkdX family protein n=1 Tax=Clostridium massiliamazoniense TaxID=1347366 RepID=UPI0009FCF477|nr:XkdX family protein [Clostridium massiliamazoniense]
MNFETWKEFYQWGMATKEQLVEAVSEGLLTSEQYKEIVGEPLVTNTEAFRKFF